MKRCPDPTANPDYCDTCHGWGHLCSAFIKSHDRETVVRVKTVYNSGYDPTRFYTSTAACQVGELVTAVIQRGKG